MTPPHYSQYPELDFPEIPIRMSGLEITNYKEFTPSCPGLAVWISIFRIYFRDITVSSIFATVVSVTFIILLIPPTGDCENDLQLSQKTEMSLATLQYNYIV